MAVTALRWAYRRLGRHYPRVFLVLELQTVYPVILGTYALFSFYYDGTTGEFFTLFGITCGLAAIAIVIACVRTFPMLRPLERVDRRRARRARDDRSVGRRDQLSVADDPLERRSSRRSSSSDPLRGALGGHARAQLDGGLPVHRRLGRRARLRVDAPLLRARDRLPPAPGRHQPAGLAPHRSERQRDLASLAAAPDAADDQRDHRHDRRRADRRGRRRGVARPRRRDRARRRDHDRARADPARRPGRSCDRSPTFRRRPSGSSTATSRSRSRSPPATRRASSPRRSTRWSQGLAERERIREAFGTYLDREVAEYILSDEFDEEGIELEVSVLFTDVRDFTGFAADAEAKEVVAALNRLFEVVVPVIARHGGHVDKFEGDGLLAVFGAPRALPRPRPAGDAGRDGDLPARERGRGGGRPAGRRRRQHGPGRGRRRRRRRAGSTSASSATP